MAILIFVKFLNTKNKSGNSTRQKRFTNKNRSPVAKG